MDVQLRLSLDAKSCLCLRRTSHPTRSFGLDQPSRSKNNPRPPAAPPMCGHEDTPSSTPRVGARVNFFSQDYGHLGNLVFHNPRAPTSPLATHAQFSSTDGLELRDDVLVSIQFVMPEPTSIPQLG